MCCELHSVLQKESGNSDQGDSDAALCWTHFPTGLMSNTVHVCSTVLNPTSLQVSPFVTAWTATSVL